MRVKSFRDKTLHIIYTTTHYAQIDVQSANAWQAESGWLDDERCAAYESSNGLRPAKRASGGALLAGEKWNPSGTPDVILRACGAAQKSISHFFSVISIGAQDRNRTSDPVIFSHVLYQLSYLGLGDGAPPKGLVCSSSQGLPSRWCRSRVTAVGLTPSSWDQGS